MDYKGTAPPEYGQFDMPEVPHQVVVQPAAAVTMQAPNVLGDIPAMATCQSCGSRRETAVTFEPNTKTHLLALGICLLGGICCVCIPYCTNSCQTAKHNCSSCGAYLGSYSN
ncbi:lipopolysaccharide-induced tumor necrosis factor-alpha factor homolog [Drosophila persimilis]|uniref:Lipopolysaccharide-induced tumor necrosis factor-alpha factor homolog n=1 Tax=Drosophila pseudoobscura pseudoobscura TaxID=46245 RepID=A0A6I8UTF0_DROPS|nr:lipopolysaccharide-induced tumor necrosis factor-alpha factor homolog [Drosophila pseudoobscura]XP_026841666.1 lipopolysaccharide-induced tumor necrosis factor-alpha factor homolog [Drosophila persimilis]